ETFKDIFLCPPIWDYLNKKLEKDFFANKFLDVLTSVSPDLFYHCPCFSDDNVFLRIPFYIDFSSNTGDTPFIFKGSDRYFCAVGDFLVIKLKYFFPDYFGHEKTQGFVGE